MIASNALLMAGIATGNPIGVGGVAASSIAQYFWYHQDAVYGGVWHWSGAYTYDNSANVVIIKDESVAGRTIAYAAGGPHYSSVSVSWPGVEIETGIHSNSMYTSGYGSASNMFYVNTSGTSHLGWDTTQSGAPIIVVAAPSSANMGAYFVSTPTWMRAYKDTPPTSC